MYVNIHTYAYLQILTPSHKIKLELTQMYAYLCIYTYIHEYILLCIYTYIHAYIHTHRYLLPAIKSNLNSRRCHFTWTLLPHDAEDPISIPRRLKMIDRVSCVCCVCVPACVYIYIYIHTSAQGFTNVHQHSYIAALIGGKV
jgi:hypothetical protein